MHRKLVFVVSIVTCLALLGAACGDDDDDGVVGVDGAADDAGVTDDTADTDEAATDAGADGECPAEGGSVTMGMFSQPAGLDPIVANGTSSTGGIELATVYDTLMRYDSATGQYEAHVAESLESNDAGDEWTLTLRSGVNFGNGDELDAAAVQASIERFQGEGNTTPLAGLSRSITSMEVVDDLTLVFTLDEPWGAFPFLLANSPGMIVNTSVADAAGDGFALDPNGAGVGAYEVAEFVPGEQIRLQARDDYWGGQVCIDDLTFVVVTGAQATYEAFTAGELDLAFLRDPEVLDQARADGIAMVEGISNMGEVININNGVRGSEPVTADVRVRRAIAHAVDPQIINERAYSGTAMATNAFFPEESRWYQGLSGPEHDPELAAELVEEVKDETGWDGSVRLTCVRTSEEVALAMKAQLDAVGFDVELDLVPSVGDLIQRVIIDADFETSCFGKNVLDEDPWVGLNSNFRTASPSNFSGYSNEDFDALLEELRRASSEDEQLALLEELQQIFNDTVPVLSLSATPVTTIHTDAVSGVVSTANGIVLLHDLSLG